MTSQVVAVLLLTYNNSGDVEQCVRSVRSQTHRHVQLHVADNASRDDTVARLRSLNIDPVLHPSNLGYAQGMNRLLGRARNAEFVLFLNADCYLDSDFIEKALERFEATPRVGVVAPLVWRSADRDEVDSGPVSITTTMRVRVQPNLDKVVHCDKPNGACPIYRRSVLDGLSRESGYLGFDTLFDTYGEDIDLALRLKRIGVRTIFDPAVTAVHRRSGSSGAISVLDKRGRLRVNVVAARYLNLFAHRPWVWCFVTAPILVLQDLGLIALAGARGDTAAFRDVLKAWTRVWASWRRKRREISAIGRARDRSQPVAS